MQRRPEFHHYPLNKQQLSQLTQERQGLEKSINENLAEIRMLNSKMAKNDYEMSYIHRLQEREKILDNKRRQLDQILRAHQYLQDQLNQNKRNEQSFKSTLANEYKNAIEEKKIRQQQQRRRRIEEEQAMLDYNKKLFEIEQQKKRRQQLDLKRTVQEELAMKQTIKQRERLEKQREKEDYNNRIAYRNNIQTQKQSAYKQYYSQFMDTQNRLQSIYQDKIVPQVQQKQKSMEEFVRKQQQQYAKEQARYHEEKVNKAARDKQMLRSFLQNQIQQKEKRKSLELEQRKAYHQQVQQYQNTLKEQGQYEKLRKRSSQKRYQQDLSSQIKMRSSLSKDNQSYLQKTHNPITNPIDFKLGVTNPYVIHQYEDTKQKYVGERDLKLRNLAIVGSNSLASQ